MIVSYTFLIIISYRGRAIVWVFLSILFKGLVVNWRINLLRIAIREFDPFDTNRGQAVYNTLNTIKLLRYHFRLLALIRIICNELNMIFATLRKNIRGKRLRCNSFVYNCGKRIMNGGNQFVDEGMLSKIEQIKILTKFDEIFNWFNLRIEILIRIYLSTVGFV